MDLANLNNWFVVYSSNRVVQTVGTNAYGKLSYIPLADVEVSLATPIGLVSITTQRLYKNTGKPYFGVGCWLDAYLPLANQESKIFAKRCEINESTFIRLPDYGVIPYKLKFRFPYWLEQINLIVRQFTDQSGRYLPVNEQVVLSAVEVVEQRQAELERLIQQQRQSV